MADEKAKDDKAPKQQADKAAKGDKAPKAEAPKAEESPLLKTLRTKLETFAKDGKTAKVNGVMAECCDISITVASIDAIEKATN